MVQFHALTVTHIHKTIRDAVVLTLQPDAPEKFNFIQGQYLTFRRDFDGVELRRSYSICAGKDDGVLQVGIKKVDGGSFSTWANEDLRVGDVVEAMPPMGNFHTEMNETHNKHYLGFAGGSGITPVLSILKTVLAQEPGSKFTLAYANRNVNSIMFRSEIEDLKNQYMERLNVIHVLEQDVQDIDLFQGRIDAEKCRLLFKHWIDIKDVDTALICGPEPMMLAISGALKDHGLTDDQIKFELFASGQQGRAKQKAKSVGTIAGKAIQGQVKMGGEARSFDMSKDDSLLDAALTNNVEAPYACKAGVCSTCKCKIVEGEVEMISNHALEDYEVEAGYVLSCQSYAVTDKVVWDYDAAGH